VMMQSCNRAILFVALLAAFCPALPAQQPDKSTAVQMCSPCPVVTDALLVSFPAQSQVASPDGRYAIIGVDTDSAPHHQVFLEDRVLKTRRNLFDYDRRIVLLWANDSKSFAVTDYLGSDTSKCSVISVDKTVRPIQVLDMLFPALNKDAREKLESRLSNRHIFVEAFAWAAPTVLTVKVSGYADADRATFEEFYDVQLHPAQP
jgi:hypothetical protein